MTCGYLHSLPLFCTCVADVVTVRYHYVTLRSVCYLIYVTLVVATHCWTGVRLLHFVPVAVHCHYVHTDLRTRYVTERYVAGLRIYGYIHTARHTFCRRLHI